MQLILASASEGRKKLLSLLKVSFKILPSKLDEDKIKSKTPLETIKLRAKLKGEEIANKIIQLSNYPINKLSNNSRRYTLDARRFLILSADSGAIHDNQLIGKPKDYQDAVKILKTLSGRTHEFVTAIYIIRISNIKRQKANPKIPILKIGLNASSDRFLQGVDTAWQVQRNLGRVGVSEKFGIEGLPINTRQTYDCSLVTFRKLTDEDIKLYLSLTNYKKYAGAYALFASPQDFITKIEGSLSNVIGLPLEKVIPILRENSFSI